MSKLERIYATITFLLISILIPTRQEAAALDHKTFKTNYTDIYYSDDNAFSDFLWRISGRRFDLQEDPSLARSRVDRIIDRVQSVLDMYPDGFKIKIDIRSEYKEGDIAQYNYKSNSITIYADRVTDGVFAHEVAHAVICHYFSEPPPSKIQEILAQYVDRHLWSDY